MRRLPREANATNDGAIVNITVGASFLESVEGQQVSRVSGKEAPWMVFDISARQKEPAGPIVDIVAA